MPCNTLDILKAIGDLSKTQVEADILYFDFLNPANVRYKRTVLWLTTKPPVLCYSADQAAFQQLKGITRFGFGEISELLPGKQVIVMWSVSVLFSSGVTQVWIIWLQSELCFPSSSWHGSPCHLPCSDWSSVGAICGQHALEMSVSPKPGVPSLGREWEQSVLPVGLHFLVLWFFWFF